MAVAGDPEHRHGIILAKNELAKKFNVQTAETIWQAKRKCPNLVCVAPHHDKYLEISKEVNKSYLNFTDLVDPFGIDESFLDVTNTVNTNKTGLRELADLVREQIRTDIGITISVGVSFCRAFAKLGSDYKKPDATTVISRENIDKIVYPMPVSNLLYAGKRATKILNDMGVITIGDLARSDKALIGIQLGKQGDMLWKYANGLDDEPVKSYYAPREVKSVGNGMTFRRDLLGEEEIKAGIAALTDTVAARMRAENVKCTVVQLLIKDSGFKTMSRQRTLQRATYLQKEITETAMELVKTNWNMEAPIRMITVTGTELVPADTVYEQISLFEMRDNLYEKQEKIEDAMAKIRGKFGSHSINFGYFGKEELGIQHRNKE